MARSSNYYPKAFAVPWEEPIAEGMSGPPIGGERNWERDATGGIVTRAEFDAPVKEKSLPPSEGLASRRRCGY